MLCQCPGPTGLPPLSLMLDDMGNPAPAELARTLGVPLASARRWVREDQAPRVVLLALFWLTRWGRSQVDCQAVNDARMQAQLARSNAEQLAAARAEIARLVALGDFGCANTPTMLAEVDQAPRASCPPRPSRPASALKCRA